MEWTEEVIGSLRAFWSEGLPTAEIGRRLGLSKNAVIGKAHRLDLPARPSPIRRPAELAAAAPRRRSAAIALPPASVLGGAPEPAPDRAPDRVPELVSDRARDQAMKPAGSPAIGQRPTEPPRPAAAHASASPSGGAPSGVSQAAAAAAVAAPSAAAQGGARPAVRMRPVEVSHPAPRSARLTACCWPIGDPGTKDFRFCDAASVPGKPYCAEHAQVAYVKVRDRREEAA